MNRFLPALITVMPSLGARKNERVYGVLGVWGGMELELATICTERKLQ